MAANDLLRILNQRTWSSLTGLKGWVERNTKYKVHAFDGVELIVSNQLISLDSGAEKGEQLHFTTTRKKSL